MFSSPKVRKSITKFFILHFVKYVSETASSFKKLDYTQSLKIYKFAQTVSTEPEKKTPPLGSEAIPTTLHVKQQKLQVPEGAGVNDFCGRLRLVRISPSIQRQ